MNEECEDLKKKILKYEQGSLTSVNNVNTGIAFSPQYKKSGFFSKTDP